MRITGARCPEALLARTKEGPSNGVRSTDQECANRRRYRRSAYSGSLAVESGKIAAVGDVSGTARREINGDGLILAPGFIDIHTHYDAQISWDSLCSRARAGMA